MLRRYAMKNVTVWSSKKDTKLCLMMLSLLRLHSVDPRWMKYEYRPLKE